LSKTETSRNATNKTVLPIKEAVQKANQKELETIYNIYNHMNEDSRRESFPGLELTNNDGDISLTEKSINLRESFPGLELMNNDGDISLKNGEKSINLSEKLRNRERRESDIKTIVPKQNSQVKKLLSNANSAENVARIIFDETNYIQRVVLGNKYDFTHEDIKERNLNYRAAEEMGSLITHLKDVVSERLYKDYVVNYLQNPKETPVIQLGQAAILLEYYQRNPPTDEEWSRFWKALRPDIAGFCFSLLGFREDLKTKALNSLLLPEIKNELGLVIDQKPIITTEDKSDISTQGNVISATSFDTKIYDPVTREEVSVTPSLHKLCSIYDSLSEFEKGKYFGELKLRDDNGAIQLSRDGVQWVTVF
jgi:hypothetical protein